MAEEDLPEVEKALEIEKEITGLARNLRQDHRRHPSESAPEGKRASTLKAILNSPLTAGVLLSVSLLLTAFNVLVAPEIAAYHGTKKNVEERLGLTLRFVREEISSFFEEKGRLPRSLDEIGVQEKADVDYQVLPGNRCRLVVHEGEDHMEEIFSPTGLQESGEKK